MERVRSRDPVPGPPWLGLPVALLLSAPPVLAATHRVPSQFATIQAAIDASTHGDTVLVATGTYSGEGNRALDFGGVDLVLLGTEPGQPCVIDCDGAAEAVALGNGETPAAVIRGFTIRHGGSDGSGQDYAVVCLNASPTLIDCTVEESYWSGLSFGGSSSPTLTDCRIAENPGYGVYLVSSGTVAMTDCTIESNGYAGIYGCSGLSLESCTIRNNGPAGTIGGGIYLGGCGSGRSHTISRCTISGNSRTGIYLGDPSTDIIQECTISGNQGPGIYGGSGTLTITGCRISGNLAESGAGIYSTGPMTATGCIITGNRATTDGGGIYCQASSPAITGCTLSGNQADGRGGALFLYGDSGPRLERTVLWGDCAGTQEDGREVMALGASTITFSCCVIDPAGVTGPGTVVWEDGNSIFADPRFCFHRPCWEAPTAEGDYSVDSLSPCLSENNDCGVAIGAEGEGCGDTPVERTTWGRIKASFRR